MARFLSGKFARDLIECCEGRKRERYNKAGNNIIQSTRGERTLNCKRFGFLPGFLRTRPFPDRTSGSGGNLALKDITMGLRWVRENIGAFGGDPERVTLMGHDTGAALVNLVLLAPYSKGKRDKLLKNKKLYFT